jgi:threonine aldolase
MEFINLISDTVTQPGKEMLEKMFSAVVGDDVFGEDPSINALQMYAASLFGKEDALFCPSGTMTNQIAINVHTRPLDEVICDEYSHIYQYEVGGYSFNSGVGINLIKGKNGKITAEQLQQAIKQDYDWLPTSTLVVLENTCNKGGGSYYTVDEIRPIQQVCRQRGLKLHLDGARLFNALVETNESTKSVGDCFDSISICLSKGLGAPVGSLLIGDKGFIKRARKVRKALGGGMRQAGYLASAGLYALQNNIPLLKIDNERCKEIGEILEGQDYVQSVRPVQSNIVIFDLPETISSDEFLAVLKKKGILASAFGPNTIRFVTHLDISEEQFESLKQLLTSHFSFESHL